MRRKIILDVDTGTDDAVALMCGLLHPQLELVAATTVSGNTEVHFCTENTLRVCDLLGRSIPVYEGASQPLARPRHTGAGRSSSLVHGDLLDLPPATSRKQAQPAVEFLLDYYRSPAGAETTLVAVAPLTNLALALERDVDFARRVPALTVMGGAHHEGNVSASAEFNVWADPEAARAVFRAGFRKLTLVPLDATHQAPISRADCEFLRELNRPATTAAASFTEKRIAGYAEVFRDQVDRAPVHDALAVLSVVLPELLTDLLEVFVDVETKGELTLGRTVLDTRTRLRRTPNARVALGADGFRFAHHLLQTLSLAPA